jgi:hypothetical protein
MEKTNWRELSNDEIAVKLISLQSEHEQIKKQMLALFDVLEFIEKDFEKGNEEINNRKRK